MRQLKKHIRQYSYRFAVRPETQAIRSDGQNALLGAKEVYEALCAPPYQRMGNFELACATVPARHVAGDFVTTFEVDGGWFLALGDLMGKGLSAAMWLTHVLDLLRRACETANTLSEAMRKLNCEMHRSRVGVPLTSLFLARLDPRESKLTYSCGGCPPAFLLHDDQVTLLERGGPILGAVPDAAYSSASIDLSLHDTLLVASDGVTEVHHGTGFDSCPDRVAQELQSLNGEPVPRIVDALIDRVHSTSPSIYDDLSVLALRRIA